MDLRRSRKSPRGGTFCKKSLPVPLPKNSNYCNRLHIPFVQEVSLSMSDPAIQPSDSFPHMESPTHVRLSLAAAMTLGFVKGWFYRGATLRCVNLLLTYEGGCKANCSFCGLAAEKHNEPADRKFIRVPWKTFSTSDVIQALKSAPDYVSRVCVSMITHPRAGRDTIELCKLIRSETEMPVSLLISPTVLRPGDLQAMKDAGADRIGVAIDAATPELFDHLRGKPVSGPHKWEKYWRTYEQALEIFGEGKAGVHLICGLGETEKETCGSNVQIRRHGRLHAFVLFFSGKRLGHGAYFVSANGGLPTNPTGSAPD